MSIRGWRFSLARGISAGRAAWGCRSCSCCRWRSADCSRSHTASSAPFSASPSPGRCRCSCPLRRCSCSWPSRIPDLRTRVASHVPERASPGERHSRHRRVNPVAEDLVLRVHYIDLLPFLGRSDSRREIAHDASADSCLEKSSRNRRARSPTSFGRIVEIDNGRRGHPVVAGRVDPFGHRQGQRRVDRRCPRQ